MGEKQCKECGGMYDLDWFRCSQGKKTSDAIRVKRQSSRCKGCEQTGRDSKKNRDPFLAKAHGAIRTHAKKFAMERRELIDVYGWSPEILANGLRHAWENGCGYCHKKFREMTGGMSAMTFDIRDPESQPYYETNVLIACSTCNKEKQRTPSDIWGKHLSNWRKWEVRRKLRQSDPDFDLDGLFTRANAE